MNPLSMTPLLRGVGRFAQLLFTVICLSMSAETFAAFETIQLGDSAPQVRATLGIPTRSVDTGDGRLLFYGAHMIYITRGSVQFMSTGKPIPVAKQLAVIPEPDRLPSFGEQIDQRRAFVREHPEFADAVETSEWVLIARLRRAIMRRAYVSVLTRDYFVLPIGMISWSHLGIRDARGKRLADENGFAKKRPLAHTMGVRIHESPPLKLSTHAN